MLTVAGLRPAAKLGRLDIDLGAREVADWHHGRTFAGSALAPETYGSLRVTGWCAQHTFNLRVDLRLDNCRRRESVSEMSVSPSLGWAERGGYGKKLASRSERSLRGRMDSYSAANTGKRKRSDDLEEERVACLEAGKKALTLGDLPANGEAQGYIYQLTFPDGMQYVGQTVDLAHRMQSHRNGNKCPKVQEWKGMFGWTSVRVQVLERPPHSQMNEREIHLIAEHGIARRWRHVHKTLRHHLRARQRVARVSTNRVTRSD